MYKIMSKIIIKNVKTMVGDGQGYLVQKEAAELNASTRENKHFEPSLKSLEGGNNSQFTW